MMVMITNAGRNSY